MPMVMGPPDVSIDTLLVPLAMKGPALATMPVSPAPLPTKYWLYTVLNCTCGDPMSYTPSIPGIKVLLACMLPTPLGASTMLLLNPVTVMVLPVMTMLLPTGPAA